jgi:hypothetical protein
MLTKLAFALLSVSLVSTVCHADNVALDKPVTLEGTFGVIRSPSSWPDASVHPVAAGSTITDGNFLGNGTEWQTGTVWWDATQPGSTANDIIINLGADYLITHVAIEADNNDNYAIDFHNLVTDSWQLLGTASAYNTNGLLTRAGNVGPVVTDAFRLSGVNGDKYYSISEFQADGTPTPLPAVLPAGLLLMGVVVAVRVRRGRLAIA